jgi:hypothetical protein
MCKLSLFSSVVILSSFAFGCGGSDDGNKGNSSTASGAGGSSGSQTASGSSTTSSGSGGATSASTNAASSSSSSGGATSSTSATTGSVSVPGNTPLSDIDTDAEAQAVCEALADELVSVDEDLTAGACALAGLIGELTGGGDCETLQAECIADDSEDPTEMTENCTADDLPDCDVTVDEYNSCVSAQIELFAGLSCDSDLENLAEEPPACVSVLERCPELAGEG